MSDTAGPEAQTTATTEPATDDTTPVADSLHQRIEALEDSLGRAREALDASERRREIDLALVESDALDLETARLLTEMAVTQMDEPDVKSAVAELRRDKPFLFRAARSVAVPTMGAGEHGAAGRDALGDAAEAAMTSGDRASLLAYLRLRRSGGV